MEPSLPLPPSPIPRYVVLADALRHRIGRGEWRPGQCLPSLHRLAGEFGVARLTARQAVQLLVGEGLLSARRGQGTFVTEAAAAVQTSRLETSLQELGATYRALSPRILELAEEPCRLPGQAAGEPAYIHMRRLHTRDGLPYCVISLYLLRDVYASAPDAFRQQAVVPLLLERADIGIARASQRLTIGTADAQTATLLRIPVHAPVAHVRRTFELADGTVVYYAEVDYRGDAITLEIDLKP